jgi:hypothetical protein
MLPDAARHLCGNALRGTGDHEVRPVLVYQAYRIPGRVYLFDLCVPPAPPAPFS